MENMFHQCLNGCKMENFNIALGHSGENGMGGEKETLDKRTP